MIILSYSAIKDLSIKCNPIKCWIKISSGALQVLADSLRSHWIELLCTHQVGNEVSGAFLRPGRFTAWQPPAAARTAQRLWAEFFQSESTCLLGFISTAAGIKVTSRHLVARLTQLKTLQKRGWKSAGRTVLSSALLHLSSFSLYTCWMSLFSLIYQLKCFFFGRHV